MKTLFNILFFSTFSVCLFSQPVIDKLEYEIDNEKVIGYFFRIPMCEKNIIANEWKYMAKNRGGKVSFLNEVLGKYRAENVVFSSLKDVGSTEMYLQILPHGTDSLIVSNSFKLFNGSFIDPHSDKTEATAALGIMKGFSFDVRKACATYDLNKALIERESLEHRLTRTNKEIYNLKRSVAISQNKLVFLEKDVASLEKQIEFYDKQMRENLDSNTLSKLRKVHKKVKYKSSKALSSVNRENRNVEKSSILISSKKADVKHLEDKIVIQKNQIQLFKQYLEDLKK